MKRSQEGAPATLGSHLRANVTIEVWCGVCNSHGRSIEPAELVKRFGENFLTKDIEPYLQCERCGQRAAEIRISPKHPTFGGYPPPIG